MKQTAVEWLEEQMKTWGDLPRWKRDEIIQQAKEMEKQQKYSINFLMWYSGMNQQQIENAHKRWINETPKTDKE
jgi:hypothetical protein